MSSFVLDASIILTWCFPDEQTQKAEEISERIAIGQKAIVPPFWPHEILNSLLIGERRKRITRELINAFLHDLSGLPIAVAESSSAMEVFSTIQVLARKHALTPYDAAYLGLAMRDGYPLATLDIDLAKAARAENVPLL